MFFKTLHEPVTWPLEYLTQYRALGGVGASLIDEDLIVISQPRGCDKRNTSAEKPPIKTREGDIRHTAGIVAAACCVHEGLA